MQKAPHPGKGGRFFSLYMCPFNLGYLLLQKLVARMLG